MKRFFSNLSATIVVAVLSGFTLSVDGVAQSSMKGSGEMGMTGGVMDPEELVSKEDAKSWAEAKIAAMEAAPGLKAGQKKNAPEIEE